MKRSRAVCIGIYQSALTISSTRSSLAESIVSFHGNMLSSSSFGEEVSSTLLEACSIHSMLSMSRVLRSRYLDKLQNGEECMLPSFCYTLPTGKEKGTFVCLDMGGSTCRVALVELTSTVDVDTGMHIRSIQSHKLNDQIRQLPADEFFAWMAIKIEQLLESTQHIGSTSYEAIPVGIAWSFPIEQLSHSSGRIQPMGKGFRCHEGVVGSDLANLVEISCQKRGLKIRVDAIINDSSATLLSNAYHDPTTTMGLILGTGTNASIYLPVDHMSREKFGFRHADWFAKAKKVIVNTELSMFGKEVLPRTRWDDFLNSSHSLPDFQPLEYMTAGRYLGEIFRLIVVEAIEKYGLFGGSPKSKLIERYSITADLLVAIENDASTESQASAIRAQRLFGLISTPNRTDMAFLKQTAQALSRRAAAYTATAVHALWRLQSSEGITALPEKTSIAVDGFVLTEYPNFRQRCQRHIADMITAEFPGANHEVLLEPTHEAAILGAAVAVAIANNTESTQILP